ncbi:UbiA family prenyltransferase [Nannocystaceae bacterium ST9]
MLSPLAPLRALDRFIRLHFFGFTALLILLGACSVDRDPGARSIATLLVIGLCFHVFAYVFNDVIDLPVDRTHPDRQADPLVRGTITPGQALFVALVQIPIALGVAWWFDASAPALLVLSFGFAAMAVYDLWGKRSPIPPLTDLAQGLAWGSLALFAALALGREPNLLTWVATAHGVGFIFLINGVHGGLRDLDNDLARRRLTTASYFGARPGLPLGRSLRRFAMAIQIAMIAVNLLALSTGAFEFSRLAALVVFVLVVALSLACLVYMVRVFEVGDPRWARDFRVHLALLQAPPMVMFAAHMALAPALLMFATMIWAFLFLDVTWEIARALVRRGARG